MPTKASAVVTMSMAITNSHPGGMGKAARCRAQLSGNVMPMTKKSNCMVGALRRSIGSSTGTRQSQSSNRFIDSRAMRTRDGMPDSESWSRRSRRICAS